MVGQRLLLALFLSAVFVLPAHGNIDIYPVSLVVGIAMITSLVIGIVLIEAAALRAGSDLSFNVSVFTSFCVNFVTAMFRMFFPWELHLVLSSVLGIGTIAHFFWWLTSTTILNSAVELSLVKWVFRISLSKRGLVLFMLANLVTVAILISLTWTAEVENSIAEQEQSAEIMDARKDQPGQLDYLAGREYESKGDIPNAITQYLLATDKGERNAASALGDIYREGRGVPQNMSEAVKWYRFAAERGDLYARSRLRAMETDRNTQ